MDIFAKSEALMVMSDATWRRHANPWSAWTRFTILPLLAMAVWSRVWLGWWCLVPVALVLTWTWINPRAFPPPADFGAWASRGVLGERIFLDRANRAIAPSHLAAARALTGAAAFGAVVYCIGLVILDFGVTMAGIVLSAGAKMWFVDRMVWIHVDETGIPLGAGMPEPIWERETQ